ALQRNDAVQARVARHAMYLYLRYAVDTRDEKSRDDDDAIEAEATAKTAFVNDEILRLSDARLARFMAAQPKLETYRYAIETIRRWRRHTLSVPEEGVLSATTALATQWQYDLYERLRAQKAAPELFAFALLRLAASRNALARLRHFHDAAAWRYFARDRTRPPLKALLERVAANADVYKRYQRLRAEHAGKTASPRFTIDEARSIVLDATAPLGEEYAAQPRALLDPANGLMDLVPGPNRKSVGLS